MGSLVDVIPGAKHTEIGGLAVDEVPAGIGRVKRVIYPPGWRWSEQMSDIFSGITGDKGTGIIISGKQSFNLLTQRFIISTGLV